MRTEVVVMDEGLFVVRKSAVAMCVLALACASAVLSTAQVGAQPDPSNGVANCTVEIATDEARLSWDGAAESFVVFRQVEGRSQFWRGRTTDASFVDSGPTNFGFVQYRVAPRSDGAIGEPVDCVFSSDVSPIDRCEARRASATDLVSYLPGQTGEGDRVAFFRSVFGNPFRLIANTPSGPFDQRFGPVESLGFPGTTEYAEARYVVRTIDEQGNVGDVVGCTPRTTIDPVPNCTATIDDDGVTVSWGRAAYDDQMFFDPFYDDRFPAGYVIRRSVDGGGTFWRGRINTNDDSVQFVDSQRSGELSYEVQALTPLEPLNRSAPTACTTIDQRSS